MRFAERIKNLREDNEEFMKIMSRADAPGMIKFSGGFPSPETYPIEDIKETMIKLLEEDAKGALSYSNTIGYDPLREQISGRMNRIFGLSSSMEEILLTSGSQQGLDLTGLLFIDKGDIVLFESPSYLGALNVLKVYEAQLVSIGTDDHGIIIDDLKKAFQTYGDKIKLIYVNPDHQNPTGRSWSRDRRIEFMEEIRRHEVAVLEDGAYAELTFPKESEKEVTRPLAYYDKTGQVVYLGTFSKTFCPGLRIGWIFAEKYLIEQYLALKTNVDLSAASILQRQVSYYLKNKDLDRHILGILKLYESRKNAMIQSIKNEFPANVEYTNPKGGIFIWMTLPEGIDAKELLKLAVEEKVSFVPGGAFYPGGHRNNELRLNFSNVTEEDIHKGMKILGALTRKLIVK